MMLNAMINAFINMAFFIAGVLIIWGYGKLVKKDVRFSVVLNHYIKGSIIYFKVMVIGAVALSALLFIFN